MLSDEMLNDHQMITALLPFKMDSVLEDAIKYNKIRSLEIVNGGYNIKLKNN